MLFMETRLSPKDWPCRYTTNITQLLLRNLSIDSKCSIKTLNKLNNITQKAIPGGKESPSSQI